MDAQNVSNFSSFSQPVVTDPSQLPPVHAGDRAPRLAYIFQQPQAHVTGQTASDGGLILMPVATAYPFKAPSNYGYRPSDFMGISLLTVFLCGIFSPPTLALSIPALIYSIKSSKSSDSKAIKQARTQGLIAAYLNLAAIIISLVSASLLVGLIVGIEGQKYYLQRCINNVRDRNGGELPTISTSSSSFFFNEQLRC